MADPIISKTWSTGDVLTATDMNSYVRDNLDYIRPRTIKASGRQTFTLNSGGGVNPSAQAGTVSFGVTFTAAPLVIMTVEIGANTDVAINLTSQPTTTQFSWRAFTAKDTSSSTQAGAFHWIAIGTVA